MNFQSLRNRLTQTAVDSKEGLRRMVSEGEQFLSDVLEEEKNRHEEKPQSIGQRARKYLAQQLKARRNSSPSQSSEPPPSQPKQPATSPVGATAPHPNPTPVDTSSPKEPPRTTPRATKKDLSQAFSTLVERSLEEKEEEVQHPAFGEILKQLTPDEALILCLFAKREHQPVLKLRAYSMFARGSKVIAEHFSSIGQTVAVRHPQRVHAYLDNLCRLGLLGADEALPEDNDLYELLERNSELQALHDKLATESKMKLKLERSRLKLTTFGAWFCEVCSVG